MLQDYHKQIKQPKIILKLKNLNKKVTSNKTKHSLVENELKKLQTFDSSIFIGQSYYNNDGLQNCLIFQPV